MGMLDSQRGILMLGRLSSLLSHFPELLPSYPLRSSPLRGDVTLVSGVERAERVRYIPPSFPYTFLLINQLPCTFFLSRKKVNAIAAHGINCFVNRQLIYNYPESLLAEKGIMVIEHADFEGVERLSLWLPVVRSLALSNDLIL
jgi:hypothetical protein